MKTKSIKAALLSVTLVSNAAAAFPQRGDGFRMSGSVIAGGGGICTGGVYSVNGSPDSADFDLIARDEIVLQFGFLPRELADLAVFYVMADSFKPGSPDEPFGCDRDSIDEMSRMISLRLQLAADRRSAFTTTLANLLLRIRTTQSGLVQNLK